MVKHKQKDSNPIIIRADTTIGKAAAETDDEYLFECFVDHPAYSAAREFNNSKMFLLARTGTGKTAILRKIEKEFKNSTSVIDLLDMSIDYVANSDILKFVKSLGVDLGLFYQVLWRHVLCIEFIRIRYKINNNNDSIKIFKKIKDFFVEDDRKKSAINYLSNWEGRFFITMDENIKEITSKLEEKLNAEFALDVQKFKTRAGYTRTLSGEKKAELISRAKNIINSEQLAELNRVLSLLADVDETEKYIDKYYILIDRLDDQWVDEEIRFDLIRALIECIRSFKKIKSLKIIVSIREDVLERVILDNKELGFQREKYDDYFLRIIWNKEQLKELLDKRINKLFHRKYSKQNIKFSDIFNKKIANKEPFDYIVERTLQRPRDIIMFINECFERAQGEIEITPKDIKEAESEYSRVRLQALIQEWKSALPSIEYGLKALANRRGRFISKDLANKSFIDDVALAILENVENESDPLRNMAQSYLDKADDHTALNFSKTLIAELYRIGAVAIKTSSNERYIYAYKDVPIIGIESIDLDTKVFIHPMLHRALNVQTDNN